MKIPRLSLPCVALCVASLIQPAVACVTERSHPQLIFDGIAATAQERDAMPQELQLRAGALLSVLLPGGMRTSGVGQDNENPALLALDEARYRELSAQGGGRIPPETEAVVSAAGRPLLGWARFGAAHTGVSWLRFTSKGKADRWLRVQVDPALPVERGTEIRLSEADENREVIVSYYDRIILELPGALGDGWAVPNAEAVGLRLVAIEPLPYPQRRVQLKFEPTSDQGKGQLELRGRSSFHLNIVHRPTPLC